MSVVVRLVGWFTIVAITGCSGGAESLPPQGSGIEHTARPGDSSTPTGGTDGGQSRCTDFETRECVIDLGVVNGIHNCAKGTQICENGAWTECASP
jgi:hypothetical protein